MDTDLAKLVLDAQGLSGAQCQGLLKIFRDLFLGDICREHRLCREEKRREGQSCNCCETQQSPPIDGLGAIHRCLASKTSSSVCCFSRYMASS